MFRPKGGEFLSIGWDELEAGHETFLADQQRLADCERWTGREIPFSELLRVSGMFPDTSVHPDHLERGRLQHELFAAYIEARVAGKTREQWVAEASGNSQVAFLSGGSGRLHLFAPTPVFEGGAIAEAVANVGDLFIGNDPDWKQPRYEITRSIPVWSCHDKPAGSLIIRLDVLTRKAAYSLKFSTYSLPSERVAIEIAVMELAIRANHRKPLHQIHLPFSPKCRLISPGGIYGGEVTFPKGGEEIKDKVRYTCLPLLAASW